MEVEEAAAAATRRVHLRTARRPARLLRPRALAALIVAHGHNAQPHLGTPGRHLRRDQCRVLQLVLVGLRAT